MARELLVLALVAATGCGGCSKSESAPAGKPLAGKAFYRIDAGPPAACASGSLCEARVVLTALGDYHVNKDYPFKFIGDPAATALEGVGDFTLDGANRGIMTLKFRPAAPGSAKVVGNFKLSVCSDETCEIESPRVELAVPVS